MTKEIRMTNAESRIYWQEYLLAGKIGTTPLL